MNSKSWFLYITKTRTGRFYTGISQNPEKRLVAHNRGYGAKFAINQGPFKLAYISPPIATKSKARQLEIKVKDWSQKKKNKLISKEWTLKVI